MSNNKNKQKQMSPAQYQEMIRNQVLEIELRARYAKANHDLMFYAIEGEKLLDPYKEFQKREETRKEEAKKQYEDFIAGLEKAQAAKDNQEGTEHTVTAEDLETNPELAEAGVQEGEKIELGPEA